MGSASTAIESEYQVTASPRQCLLESSEKDTECVHSMFSLPEKSFENVDLNKNQTATILRQKIQKHEQLVDADYGFKFRASHSKLLFEAMKESLEEIIKMKEKDEDEASQKQLKAATEGKFF